MNGVYNTRVFRIKEPLQNYVSQRNLQTLCEKRERATKPYQVPIRRGALSALQPKFANCSRKIVLQRFLKQFFRIAIEKFLEALVRIKLARAKPTIIGITGSYGKTTTKEAVYEVLKTRWLVYRNPKSLNTEIGLLLAVLEQPSGFQNPLRWTAILMRAVFNAFTGKRYDFMVLEYGADKPGDIEHLIKIVKPHIAVITGIARVHQAAGQFKSIDEVFYEKKKLVTCLKKSGAAILNRRDAFLKRLEGALDARTLWFGNKKVAPVGRSNNLASLRLGLSDIFAEDVKNTGNGFSATIHCYEDKIHASFPIAGSFHIDAFLPALLCGKLHGVTLAEGVRALQSFRLPPGRMSIIAGAHGATLLDSSYNASPETMKQALALLKDFPGKGAPSGTVLSSPAAARPKRKIAVLGNMNELGDYTEAAHREIGRMIGPWLDQLVTVGDFARIVAETALKRGFPESRIKILSSASEAANFLLSEKLSKGDIILFKGSQNRVRLERAVKMLMARPEDAKKLLCRQEEEWKGIE